MIFMIRNFGYGTEIMKLCQEIVCPVSSFNCQEKCIEQSRHCEHLPFGFYLHLLFDGLILGDSHLYACRLRDARGPSPVIARESSLKYWRLTLNTCSTFTQSI